VATGSRGWDLCGQALRIITLGRNEIKECRATFGKGDVAAAAANYDTSLSGGSV
jgi:hypothetical protein